VSKQLNPKSYLIRAMYEYINDINGVPHIGLDTKVAFAFEGDLGADNNTESPVLALSISKNAVVDLVISIDGINFKGTVNSVPFNYFIPIEAIGSIHDRDTGQGIQFEITTDDVPKLKPNMPPTKPKLTIVK